MVSLVFDGDPPRDLEDFGLHFWPRADRQFLSPAPSVTHEATAIRIHDVLPSTVPTD